MNRWIPVLSLALVGCSNEDPDTMEKFQAVAQAPLPAVMEFAVDKIEGGQPATFSVRGGPPSGTVKIVRALPGVIGNGPCPGALGGECLDIDGPVKLFGGVTLDAAGNGSRTVTIPAGVSAGRPVAFQMVDAATNTGSNPMGLRTGPVPCPDVLEPNDDAFGALPALPARAEYMGICGGSPADADWFRVDVPAGMTLTVDLWFHDDTNDLDLYLFAAPQANLAADWSVNYLVRGFGVSNHETISYANTSGVPATWYVAVHDWNFDATTDTRYSLYSSIAP